MQGSVTGSVRSRNVQTVMEERERQAKFWIDRGLPREIRTTPAEFLASIPPLEASRVQEGCDRWTLPALLVDPRMPLARFCEWRRVKSADPRFSIDAVKDAANAKRNPYWLYFVTTMAKRNGAPVLSALELLFFMSIVSRFPEAYRILSGSPWDGNGGKEFVAFAPPKQIGGEAGTLVHGSFGLVGNLETRNNWTVAVHAGVA